MAEYLVTGGAGFIGSHIVEALVQRGERVRVLDDLSTGRLENLAAVRDRIQWHQGDIRDRDGIRSCFGGVDYVLHLAALSSVARSLADPAATNSVNIDGTLNVLLLAREAGVKRVVFAGSAAVYGDSPGLPRSEGQPPRPLSFYALTKLTGEYYCQLFTRLFGLEAVALRFFNIFGPRQDPESPYSGVLSKFVMAYLREETPTIFGDGEQSRDFTYVTNVVEAVLRACSASGAAGGVINVGTGQRYTLNQTVDLLNDIFQRRITPRRGPPRQGDVRDSQADLTLARQLLGYEPQVSFEEGLRKSVDWYASRIRVGGSG
jgi:nucleoside-diphosphate-sugar epimerase